MAVFTITIVALLLVLAIGVGIPMAKARRRRRVQAATGRRDVNPEQPLPPHKGGHVRQERVTQS